MLSLEEVEDIYFTEKYGKIYEKNNEGVLETYRYESLKGKVIYRFLKRKIDLIKEEKLYDIATPYGYGGPLFLDYKDEYLEDLIIEFKNDFKKYCKENKIVSEFVRFHPIVENYRKMYLYMDIQNIRSTICMELKDEEYIWDNLSSKCKNKIRKARKNGVEILKGSKKEDLKEFFDLYNKTMEKNSATHYYYFSKEFFENAIDFLGDNVEIFKAVYKGKTVLSALIMTYGDYAHYHLSGSEEESLKLGVNNLFVYEVAMWACNEGYKYFHLGGGYEGNHDSLFKFKKAFSKSEDGEKNFYIGKNINMKKEYDKLVEIYKKENNLNDTNLNFFPVYRG